MHPECRVKAPSKKDGTFSANFDYRREHFDENEFSYTGVIIQSTPSMGAVDIKRKRRRVKLEDVLTH